MKTSRRLAIAIVAVAAILAATASTIALSAGHAEFAKQVTIPVSRARSLSFTITAEASNVAGHHSYSRRFDVHFAPAHPLAVQVSAEVGSADSI